MADETSGSFSNMDMSRAAINDRIAAGQKLEPETNKPKPKEGSSFIQNLKTIGRRLTGNSTPAAPLDMGVEAQAQRAGKTFDARLTPDAAHSRMKANLSEFGGYKDSTPAVTKPNKVEAGVIKNPINPDQESDKQTVS